MAVPSPAGPMRWSIGPCHRIASVGGRSIRSPKRKDTVFTAKINFCAALQHYETVARPLHASFYTTMADAFCPQPITIPAILSYCGSALDVGLNYSLLAINVVGFGALYRLSSEASPSLGIVLISFGFGEYLWYSYINSGEKSHITMHILVPVVCLLIKGGSIRMRRADKCTKIPRLCLLLLYATIGSTNDPYLHPYLYLIEPHRSDRVSDRSMPDR